MARKKYYIVFDTEATNGLDDPLVYDLGFAVIDKTGKIYEAYSFVIYDVYVGCKEQMKTAYYRDKLPQYEKDLKSGKRKMVSLFTAKKVFAEVCRRFKVSAIMAHNAKFDIRALNTTIRYLTKSKVRYFFPYGVEIWCTLKMSRSIFRNKPLYKRFCIDNGYIYNKTVPRMTAEIIYRFISNRDNFVERHTGLEDVMIEKEIFAYLKRQHKKMEYLPFAT